MLSKIEFEQLPDAIKTHITTLENRLNERNSEIEDLQEKLQLALFRKFGRTTESASSILQHNLFEEEAASQDETPKAAGSVTKVEAHTRKKQGRKPLSKDLPRVDVLYDIPEEEKHCGCGHELSKIDEEISEKLKIIPEQVFVERHIRPKYACRNCEGSGDEEKAVFRIAPVEPSIIPKSIVTPELLAFIIVNKFVDHLPFYRQEGRFQRIGASISRQNMSNWQQKAYEVLLPLKELFKSQILTGNVINMDETTVQVMGEDGKANTSKSYMWLARGGPAATPVIYYEYHCSRSSEYASQFLSEFKGYLQTDGYAGYDKTLKDRADITHVGCMAHVRRKFFEAAKSSKKAGSAQMGVSKIKEFYRIEKELRASNLSKDDFLEVRKVQITPIAKDFKLWLDEKAETVRPSSNTGKAVRYALSQWGKVMNYLEHPDLTPDNNSAENAIRPFVLGRKNWLFSGSPTGAQSSCLMYSLIETAKQNGLNPYGYLNHVFTMAPRATDQNDWKKLLPWNIDSDLLQLKTKNQA